MRMVSGALVGMYAARYLGPSGYGALNLVITICALAMTVGRMGIDSVMVRELTHANSEEGKIRLLSAGFWLMNIVGVGIYAIGAVVAFFLSDRTQFFGLLIYGLALFTQGSMVIDYYSQHKSAVKTVVQIKVVCLALSSVATVVAVVCSAAPLFFYVIPLVEKIVLSFALGFHKRHFGLPSRYSVAAWEDMLALARAAKMMLATTIFQSLYSRLDHLVIAALLSTESLGLYAVAVRFYEAFSSLPYLIATSLLPNMLRWKKAGDQEYYSRLRKLMGAFFWGCLAISAVTSCAFFVLLPKFMGDEYSASVWPLSIMCCAVPFLAVGTVGIRHQIVVGLDSKIAKRSISSSILSLCIGFPLIQFFGINGAAISLFVTTVLINVAFDFLDTDLVGLARIKLSAMSPFFYFNERL